MNNLIFQALKLFCDNLSFRSCNFDQTFQIWFFLIRVLKDSEKLKQVFHNMLCSAWDDEHVWCITNFYTELERQWHDWLVTWSLQAYQNAAQSEWELIIVYIFCEHVWMNCYKSMSFDILEFLQLKQNLTQHCCIFIWYLKIKKKKEFNSMFVFRNILWKCSLCFW